MERFTFTVGKLDAGMAILIGERAHLIEFPSILLPPGVTSGSIVNISVNRNHKAENAHLTEFWALQDSILTEYGLSSPTPPELRLRHVTQTSVTLEWPQLNLAKAKLRSLEIFKDGQRLALIPNAGNNTSTKLSSLQHDKEYTFQLVLKTTAGTYPSNIIRVQTHTMTDTSGISVCFGHIDDPILLSHAKQALDHMNAKWTDKIQIDTTHFVCTGPGRVVVEDDEEEVRGEYEEGGGGRRAKGRGASGLSSPEYQKAVQMNLPIVQPHWVLACHQDKKLVAVSSFQLGATAPIQYVNSARFSRGESSKPGSPIRRDSMNAAAQAASIARAPSPETIARMSVEPTSHQSETRSQKSSGTRSTPTSPTLEAPQHRFGESQSIGQVADAYQEPSYTQSVERSQSPPPASPRSPKPEADGKLDRGFKFPTSESRPGTPTLPAAGAAVTGSQAAAKALNRAKQEEGELPEPLREGSGEGAAMLEPEAEEIREEDAVPLETVTSDAKAAVAAESAAIDDLIIGAGSEPTISTPATFTPSLEPARPTDNVEASIPLTKAVPEPAQEEEKGPIDQAIEKVDDLIANGSTKMAEFIKESSSAPAAAPEQETEEIAKERLIEAGVPEAEAEGDVAATATAVDPAHDAVAGIVEGGDDRVALAELPTTQPLDMTSDEPGPEEPAPAVAVAKLEEIIEIADEGHAADEDEDEGGLDAKFEGTPVTSDDQSGTPAGTSAAKKGKKKKGGKGKKK